MILLLKLSSQSHHCHGHINYRFFSLLSPTNPPLLGYCSNRVLGFHSLSQTTVICSWNSKLIHGRRALYFDMRTFPVNSEWIPLLQQVSNLSTYPNEVLSVQELLMRSNFFCLHFCSEISLLRSVDNPVSLMRPT